MTSAAISPIQSPPGPRAVALRTDLAGIADLIELCFASVIDESGRAAVREMRAVAKSGPLMFLLNGVDSTLGGLNLGYVWAENGRIVGNVSVSRAFVPSEKGAVYLIANVATHPDYRRHHIAQTLMELSLDLIRARGGKTALLQVDANNPGAQRMYTTLGFRDERTFTRWHRASFRNSVARVVEMPPITLLDGNWRAQYRLAQAARPQQQGGIGWLRPTLPGTFKPSFWGILGRFMAMKGIEEYIVRDTANPSELAASLRIEGNFGGPDRFELMVHPRYSSQNNGYYERTLINFGIRRSTERFHSVSMEHPADDTAANAVLENYQFDRKQTTLQMRYDL